ncbi:unnamed protein product [Effrenium voratum]|nr:unnamed protein product [Effrenium voratum]
MLAADKLELTSLIKKNAVELKGKELELNKSNFEAVATQAAVLAGFAICMLVKIDIPDGVPAVLCALYYVLALANLASHLACLGSVAAVNILATSLGLRGPDGSVRQAADGMHQQRDRVFWCFGSGLVSCCLAPWHAAISISHAAKWGQAMQ